MKYILEINDFRGLMEILGAIFNWDLQGYVSDIKKIEEEK